MIYVYGGDIDPIHPVIFNDVPKAINFTIKYSLDNPDDIILIDRTDADSRNHNLSLVFKAGKAIDD